MSVEHLHDRTIVRDEHGRTIHLRPRFNWGIRQKLKGASHRNFGQSDAHIDIGEWNLTALSLTIFQWEGPDLGRKNISIESIMALPDSCDALLEETMDVIVQANSPKAPSPNGEIAPTTDGVPSSEEAENPQPPASMTLP